MADEATTKPVARIGPRQLREYDAGGLGPPATQLGPIRLIRRIGKGGMGEVWLGKHELLGRDVAVKFLLAAAMDQNDPAFTTFLAGARVAATVTHRGLNQVHHADVAAGVPYLVLELLEGCNLHELVERSGPINPAAARAIIEAVCEAVAELHHQDLVHRDLKPSNFVLTVDGRTVVTDFGLACARPPAAASHQSGMVAGTPAYMAPEMFDGIVSARTDVYALCMSAYQLLYGRPAFTGSVEELRRQHREVAIDTQPLRAAGVPEGVIDVIVRATTKDALFRPKSARHLLDAFRAAFDAARIEGATGRELAELMKKCTSDVVKDAPKSAVSNSALYPTLSALAQWRHEHRRRREARSAVHDAVSSEAASLEKHCRRVERRRARIVGAIASLVGACAAFVILRFVTLWHLAWNDWVSHNVPRASSTGSGNPLFHSAFPWAQFVIIALQIAAVTIGGVGVSLCLHRWFRGKRLHEFAEITTCGWCRHELRGISIPICSECGHRVGDMGPDEQGLLPMVRQPGYRWRVLILLHVVFLLMTAVSVAVIGIVMRLILRGIGGSFSSVVVFLPAFFVALEATLVCYEASADYALAHSGRAWCRHCQGELPNLVEPVCPSCGAKI